MNDKNNNSDSEDNPFGESLGLFDELPLPEKTAETPDSKKETPASGSPPGKKVQQKPPVKKPPDKMVAPPAPEKSKPSVKKPVKESPAKKTPGPKETPGKKGGIIRNTLIFGPLVVVLVIVSMYIGALINFDSIFTNKNEEDALKPVHEPVSNENKTKKTATTPEEIKPPSQEEDSVEINDQLTETQPADTTEEKDTNEISKVIKERILSYPYSIYLGSYSGIAKVKEASSDYSAMGLSPYWIKLDLGEKGIWYRLFSGYFQSRKEADEFIKTMKIQGAESKLTKYANLVGTFTSKADIDKYKNRLEEEGYSPYIINDAEDTYRLYTGAFYQINRAKEQHSDLALNGIESELVER